MWFFLCVAIGNIILQLNVVQTERLNQNTGAIDFHAKIGNVQEKYQELDNNDKKVSQKVATLTEMMRPAFPTGFGPLPPLDPYTQHEFEPIAFNAPNRWLRGQVYLKNLSVVGAQKFSLQSFETRLKNSRSDASINVPQIHAEVDFEVHATFGLIPIVFGGHLKVVLSGVSVTGAMGAAEMTFNNQQVFQLVSADVNCRVQNIEIDVTSFHLGKGMKEIPTNFSIVKWINKLKDDIAMAVVRTTMEAINSPLKTYTVDQVIAFLLS